MRQLNIDFAPPSLRRSLSRLRLLTVVLGALALVLCVTLATRSMKLAREQAARLATLESLQAKQNASDAPKPVVKRTPIPELQAQAINRATERLNLPWMALLDALESATPPTIALLSLEPDPKKRVLKGTAEARTSDDMVGYIESLKKQPLFAQVLLAKHEINEQDPNRPLRFQFEALWVEVAP